MKPVEWEDTYTPMRDGWENHDDPDPPDQDNPDAPIGNGSYMGPIAGTFSSEFTAHATLTYMSDLIGNEELDGTPGWYTDAVQAAVDYDANSSYGAALQGSASIMESMEAECDYSAEVSGYGDFIDGDDGDEDGEGDGDGESE